MSTNQKNAHKPYQEILNRPHDFLIAYELSQDYVSRGISLVFQGIRPVFSYKRSTVKNQYHIWPEFETEGGKIIKRLDVPIRPKGRARMWIIHEDELQFHSQNIKVGTECFLFLDDKLLAKCKVIESSIK